MFYFIYLFVYFFRGGGRERRNKKRERLIAGSRMVWVSGRIYRGNLFFNDDSMISLQQGLAKDKVREMRELILERYDKNYDGRLEINEVSL